MNTDVELAAARERVERLEVEQALAGFSASAEVARGIPQPGTAGQSPMNALAIAKLETAEAEAAARARAANLKPDDREAVVRYLSAGQSLEAQSYIRQTVR